MNASLSNFNELCNHIRGKAIRDINQNLPDNKLVKWQKLLTAILETELAMHRVRSALKLLRTLPPREILNMFSMSEGAWIDYQLGTWSFWMCSLLEKKIELVSQVAQKLIKPNNPQYRDIERPLLKSLRARKDSIGKIRHPLAHKGEGGTIEWAVNTDSWRDYVNIPSPVDYNHVLNSSVPYHLRWYNFLYRRSLLDIAEIERISEELSKHINWSSI